MARIWGNCERGEDSPQKFFWKVRHAHAILRPEISEDPYAKDAVEVHADIASQGWQRAMNMEDQHDNAHHRRDGGHWSAHGPRPPGGGGRRGGHLLPDLAGAQRH